MLDYCPNCKCKIRFYKAHECDKMKHELADAVKLAGDVIASSDDCKVKENTAHGIFRIWCVLRNTIEIICDIIKRLRCVQKKSQKVCEAQHCLANRIEEVNKMIGAVNEGTARTPDPAVVDWEIARDQANAKYNKELSSYNGKKAEHDRQTQAYNQANANYNSALQAYNQRKADYERRKREYEAGQGQSGSRIQWQEAWGTYARSGAPADVAMVGSPNNSIMGMDLGKAKQAGYGTGIGFETLNDEGTSVKVHLNLIGLSEVGLKYQGNSNYVAPDGNAGLATGFDYGWFATLQYSTNGGSSWTNLVAREKVASHPTPMNLAYQEDGRRKHWTQANIRWEKQLQLPANFTHLRFEVYGDTAQEHHENIFAKDAVIRKPFPPFTEQPPVNNAQAPKPFTEQPPKQPTIPPKPEKKFEPIPLIKGGCELMDCNFDCFNDDTRPPLNIPHDLPSQL